VLAAQASYIAGFFDGDGSIHFQFARQDGYKFGYYIRSSISFSQSTSAKAGLEQIRGWVGGGYMRDRRTGMSDLIHYFTAIALELAPSNEAIRGIQARACQPRSPIVADDQTSS
jgi:hypothetical protein